jgi:Na+-translocating ferredoxin:NAD+ oxidoreductase RnfD subunit
MIASGTTLNTRVTKRLPLIGGWLLGFAGQALLRAAMFGTPPQAGLVPMTGVAFILFTFYMITDPATTPSTARGQMTFGLAVAGMYGVLLALHVVFGLFFALVLVSLARGVALYATAWLGDRPPAKLGAPVAAPPGV